MVICAVTNCGSSNNKNLLRNKHSNGAPMRYFAFPKDETLAKIWLKRCNRKAKSINTNTARVCSRHFTPEHYICSLQHSLLGYTPKRGRILKIDAIPTENLPPNVVVAQSNDPKVTAGKRQSKYIKIKEDKRVVEDIFNKIEE